MKKISWLFTLAMVMAVGTTMVSASDVAPCLIQGSIRISNGIDATPPEHVFNYQVVLSGNLRSSSPLATGDRQVAPWLLGNGFQTVIYTVPYGAPVGSTVRYVVHDLAGNVLGSETVTLGNNQVYIFDPESVATPPGCGS